VKLSRKYLDNVLSFTSWQSDLIFFSNDEVIFYSSVSNLSEKIQKFAKDDYLRKKIILLRIFM